MVEANHSNKTCPTFEADYLEIQSQKGKMDNEIDEILLATILEKYGSPKISVKRYEITRNVIEAGSNYCSEIMKLFVEYEIENESKQISFILKVPFTMPAYKIFAKSGMYDKESFMYENIIPKIHHLVGGYNVAPKHYHTTKLKSLILEDLSELGYVMKDRNEQLNFEESKTTLKSLAVFHGASYNLRQKNSDLIKRVAAETYFNNRNFVKDRLEVAWRCWSLFLQKEQIESKFIRRLPLLIDKILEELLVILSSEPYDFSVLNHGDLWTNNILFKYDKKGRVGRVKLIDFQSCRWTSPANDIIIFATTSIKFEIFEKHFDQLLSVYLETLNQTLAELGHDRIYTEDQLKNDLEKAKLFRIVILAMYLNVTLSDSDNVMIFENDENENLTAKNIEGTYRSANYKTNMVKWLRYLDENYLY